MEITVHVYLHEGSDGVDRKLDHVLHVVSALAAQEKQVMAGVNDIKQLVRDLDDETNAVADKVDAQTAKIQELKDQIAAGGTVSQADLDEIAAGLTPISDRLKSLGANTDQPIPPAPPA